jgi:hypothetical protein
MIVIPALFLKYGRAEVRAAESGFKLGQESIATGD